MQLQFYDSHAAEPDLSRIKLKLDYKEEDLLENSNDLPMYNVLIAYTLIRGLSKFKRFYKRHFQSFYNNFRHFLKSLL